MVVVLLLVLIAGNNGVGVLERHDVETHRNWLIVLSLTERLGRLHRRRGSFGEIVR